MSRKRKLKRYVVDIDDESNDWPHCATVWAECRNADEVFLPKAEAEALGLEEVPDAVPGYFIVGGHEVEPWDLTDHGIDGEFFRLDTTNGGVRFGRKVRE